MTEKTPLTTKDIEFVKNTVVKAGKLADAYARRGFTESRKSDASIVTNADIAVQEMLAKAIGRRFKQANFICEETANAAEMPSELAVIIDPIDGTAVFSMGLPCWCVSVGVFYDMQPVHGFVYAPRCDMFFWTDHTSSYLNKRRLAPSGLLPETETNYFLASETMRSYNLAAKGKIRNLGSTALHACLVAAGSLNRSLAFLGESMLWDWAGSLAILSKAGCSVHYINGEPLDIAAIAANGFKLPQAAVACSNPKVKAMELFAPR